jgi:serine/threonine protein kinase
MQGPKTSPSSITIFNEALGLDSPADRAAYLDRVCADDSALRARVEALLAVHDRAGGFLESPARGPTIDEVREEPAEGVGTVIGPYRLMEQIGEGGMGIVFVAEQTRPVRRRVALKIIKPGMDTKQVIARFEAERQALALMDHPTIARVLDAGATESGRPYFVMELVRGIPITEYCDQERLSIPERLELFVQVCRAVQHAHQKGIIHRDLKPSNILVTIIDGVAVPKIIDFGVAKATGQSLTERTLYTAFHEFIGTPAYMSPEQAALAGVDVDTRSDIYSLGVLLYELLTGTTPFDSETLKRAAFDELRRIIREQEPPRPSTRLSTLGERRTSVAAVRQVDARQLDRTMRGELDWIVMKALDKDRRRRYETANDFAADVMRYLTHQPVEACPPSAWYRFTKYARRNRAGLTAAALVSGALLLGLAASVAMAVRAIKAERRAMTALTDSRRKAEEMQQVVDYLAKDVFGAAAPEKSHGKPVTVLEVLSANETNIVPRFGDQPLVEATVRLAIGESYAALGQTDIGEPHLFRAVSLRVRHLGPEHPETVAAEAALVTNLRREGWRVKGHYETAERIGRHVLDVRRRTIGPEHQDTLNSMSELALILIARDQLDEALALAEQALTIATRRPGVGPACVIKMRHNMALILKERHDLKRAEELIRAVVEADRRIHGLDHPETIDALQDLGDILSQRGLTEEASRLYRDNLERVRRVFGIDCLRTVSTMDRVVSMTLREGGVAAVRDLYERWLREYLVAPTENDPYWRYRRSVRISSCAFSLVTLPEPVPYDTALALRGAETAVAIDSNWDWVYTVLGIVHYRLGHLDKAEEAIRASMERPKFRGGCGNDWWVLALILARRGEMAQARTWYERGLAWDGRDKVVWRENFLRLRDEVAALLGVSPPADEANSTTAPEAKEPTG